MATNLLKNPSFEGKTYAIDGGGSQWVPEHWQLWVYPPDAPMRPGQDVRWGGPNLGCININLVPEHEHKLLFVDGTHCWKIWTESSWPFGFVLSQTVAVTAGKRYRFTINVFPDMVVDYGPKGKIFSTDYYASAVQVLAKSGGQTFTTGFQDGSKIPSGKYSPLALDFTAPASEVEVAVEAFGFFGIKNNCFFFDAFSLVEIEAPAPVIAKPTPPAKNFLSNGGFEEGRAYPYEGHQEVQVPSGWMLELKEAGIPATALVNFQALPDADRARLSGEGGYGWKITGEREPFALRLSQGVSGFAVGQACKVSVYVAPAFPDGAYAGEVNLTATHGDQMAETGWKAGRDLAHDRYTKLELTLTAQDKRIEVALDVRAQNAIPGGAWYVDVIALEKV